MDTLVQIAQLIAAFAILIVLHEGGHFVAAKMFKVRVEKFYLFFDGWGIKLFSTYWPRVRKLMGKEPVRKQDNGTYEYQGTEYGIGWIPLGGYVSIAGMIDETKDINKLSAKPEPWEFRTKPAWQRLIIMLGGIIVNFITAFVIYSVVLLINGESYVAPEDMTYGMKFSEAAQKDGFRDGDKIIKIDDQPLEKWTVACLRDISNAKTVTVRRNDEKKVITLPAGMSMLDMIEPMYAQERLPLCVDSVMPGTPAAECGLRKGDVITAVNGDSVADFNDFTAKLATLSTSLKKNAISADSLRVRTVMLSVNGIEKAVVLTSDFKLGFSNAIPDYNITTKEYNWLTCVPAGVAFGWNQMKGYVNDLKYIFTKKGVKSMSGPVGIVQIFPETWDWTKFWLLTAFLSIALGVMNVLPIPALDGGHALIALFEIITGKKPSDKFLNRVQIIGFWIIIALFVFITGNDILKLFGLSL